MPIQDLDLYNKAVAAYGKYLQDSYVRVVLSHCISIGLDKTEVLEIHFSNRHFSHLYGAGYDAAWIQEKKARALMRLSNPYDWKMCAQYTAYGYRNLDCDVLIGTQFEGFGLRWDDEDGMYIPVSCIEEDIRQSYDRLSQSGIERIEIEDW